jgi:hypothetical protein
MLAMEEIDGLGMPTGDVRPAQMRPAQMLPDHRSVFDSTNALSPEWRCRDLVCSISIATEPAKFTLIGILGL